MVKNYIKISIFIFRLSRINVINDMAKSIFISPKNLNKVMIKRDIAKEYKVRVKF